MIYHPKGSMCAACVHAQRDCSHLPFDTMPVIERYMLTGYKHGIPGVVVRCTEFVRKEKVS